MATKARGNTKLIWAIDAFAEKGTQAPAARLLHLLSSKTGCAVEPVHVLNPSGYPMTTNRESILFFLPRVEQALQNLAKEYEFLKIEPFKILVQRSPSLRKAVKSLLSYAASENAEAIVVSTRAKKGIARMLMGSFAETLILQSRIPVFSINPTARIESTLSPILFPTDFGDGSWVAFQEVVRLAKTLGAKVTCFHQFRCAESTVPKNVLYEREGTWQCADSQLTDEIQLQNQTKYEKWREWAQKYGVRCDSIFRFGLRNVADAAISASRETESRLIALAATTGPTATTLIGRTSRWIVRSADSPVWVLYVPSK